MKRQKTLDNFRSW